MNISRHVVSTALALAGLAGGSVGAIAGVARDGGSTSRAPAEFPVEVDVAERVDPGRL